MSDHESGTSFLLDSQTMSPNATSEKYQRLVENLKDTYFFYTHDTHGVFTQISSSITDVLGYSPEEFLRHFTEYLTDNPINEQVVEHTDLSMKGIQQPSYEVEILHRDGSAHFLEVSEYPLFDQQGQVVGVEGIAHDITRRKRDEEEKQRLITELQGALAEIQSLRGIIPICANCKRIRNDKGYWQRVEDYIQAHSDVEFSHGICPECMEELYPRVKTS